MNNKILWWGRSDKNYSRNLIIRKLLSELGFQIMDFRPLFSKFVGLDAKIRINSKPFLVWVPCFRQRDIKSACNWAKNYGIPVVFDPLISSWDKKINEQKRFSKNSKESIQIKMNESILFNLSDFLIADTESHKSFFTKEFNIPNKKIHVINVGADENIFYPRKNQELISNEVLFYGSFLELHGVDVIIEAARKLFKQSINFTLIGDFKKINYSLLPSNIKLEPFMSIEKLSLRINRATLLLGIFSDSQKANNVIPNKVYQSLASGKPIITRTAEAYPKFLRKKNMGIYFIEPNNPNALAKTISILIKDKKQILKAGNFARKTYERFFSEKILKKQIQNLLKKLL